MSAYPSMIHRKIGGFHPPASCPPDLTQQVQSIIWKYNHLIGETDDLRREISELKKQENVLTEERDELAVKFELLDDEHEKLLKKYDDLKQASELLADRYEQNQKLLARSNKQIIIEPESSDDESK